MTDTQIDWRYSDDKLKLREECLKILLTKFGRQMEGTIPKYHSQSIYNCAHDWVSQGHKISNGVVAYYKTYYDPNKRPNQISEEST